MAEEQQRGPGTVRRHDPSVGRGALWPDRSQQQHTDDGEAERAHQPPPSAHEPRMRTRSTRQRAHGSPGASGGDPDHRRERERLPDDAVEPNSLGKHAAARVQPQPHERCDDDDRERVRGSDHRPREESRAERGTGMPGRRSSGQEEHPHPEAGSQQERDGQATGHASRAGHIDRDPVERELVEPTELERGGKSESATEDLDQRGDDLGGQRGHDERDDPAPDHEQRHRPRPRTAIRGVHLRGSRGRRGPHPAATCTNSATCVGVRPTRTPAASSASAFAAAVPLEPVTMAPACPMRLPGGASNPAM